MAPIVHASRTRSAFLLAIAALLLAACAGQTDAPAEDREQYERHILRNIGG